MASTARMPSVTPTPKPALAPDVIPDESDASAATEVIDIVAVVRADVADVREINSLSEDAVEAEVAELLDDENLLIRGSTASAVPVTAGLSALNTNSSSLQQLVFRLVTPASSVPWGAQQNSFCGS